MPYPLVKLAELSSPCPPSLRRMVLSAIHGGAMGRADPWPQRGTCPSHPPRTKNLLALEPADVRTTARLLCRVVAAEQLHSSISVPLGSTQMPRSPAVVFSMRVLPPNGTVHRCGVGHADHRRSGLRLGATADGQCRKYCAGGSKCFSWTQCSKCRLFMEPQKS